MFRIETVFNAMPSITPDFAAMLADHANRYTSEVFLERGTTRLCVDSLIGILSMDLRRGNRVTICAEGGDEAQAAENIRAVLESNYTGTRASI